MIMLYVMKIVLCLLFQFTYRCQKSETPSVYFWSIYLAIDVECAA